MSDKEKDKQFREILELNGRLIDLGNDLVLAIEDFARYDNLGQSIHMKNAIENWKENKKENYTAIP